MRRLNVPTIILLIIVIVLFVALSLSLMSNYQNQQTYKRVIDETSSRIMDGIFSSRSILLTQLKHIENTQPDQLENFDLSGLITQSQIVEDITWIMQRKYTRLTDEAKVVRSIRTTFDHMNRFVRQVELYLQNQQPFSLTTCENISFHNKEEITIELNKYFQILENIEDPQPLEVDVLWEAVVQSWDIDAAEQIYRCDLRL